MLFTTFRPILARVAFDKGGLIRVILSKDVRGRLPAAKRRAIKYPSNTQAPRISGPSERFIAPATTVFRPAIKYPSNTQTLGFLPVRKRDRPFAMLGIKELRPVRHIPHQLVGRILIHRPDFLRRHSFRQQP